jgi:hypothetical protein
MDLSEQDGSSSNLLFQRSKQGGPKLNASGSNVDRDTNTTGRISSSQSLLDITFNFVHIAILAGPLGNTQIK